MIEDVREYELIKGALRELEIAIEKYPPIPPNNICPYFWQASFEALISTKDDWIKKITDYEKTLKTH